MTIDPRLRGEIEQFLTERPTSQTLCISDFDGTFYRGVSPQLLRGISNAEFAFFLWILHIKPWTTGWALLCALKRLRRESNQVYRQGVDSAGRLSELEQPLIERFSEHVLSLCDYTRAEKAASWTARFYYRDAAETMKLLQHYVGSLIFISKAFPMVLNAVRERLKSNGLTLPVYYRGIVLKENPWWQIDPEQSVLTRQDKKKVLADFAMTHPEYRRAVVFGDTEDDLALLDEGTEIWGEGNVILIGLYPKDEYIRQKSTAVLEDWNSVRKLLAGIDGRFTRDSK